MVPPGNVNVVAPQRFNQFGKHIATRGIKVNPEDVAGSGVAEDDLAANEGESMADSVAGIENHLNAMINDDDCDIDLLDEAIAELADTDDGWEPLPNYEEGSW